MQDNNTPDPNDMSTDMTDEELQSFVNNHLGELEQTETTPEPPIPPTEPETPVIPQTPSAPETPPTPPITPVQPPVQTPPTEPELPVEVDTSDLFIEFKTPDTTDENGKVIPGKTIKLGVDDELPDDVKFSSEKQLAEVLEARKEMRDEKNARAAELETKHNERTEKENQEKTLKDNQARLDAEIDSLIEAGLLEKPKLAMTDPNFLQDTAVQKIDAVLKFMVDKNKELTTAGKTPISSFGTALTLYNKQESDKSTTDAKKLEEEEIKRRGAMVGGGSSTPTAPSKKVYEAGSAKSIWDVPVDADGN